MLVTLIQSLDLYFLLTSDFVKFYLASNFLGGSTTKKNREQSYILATTRGGNHHFIHPLRRASVEMTRSVENSTGKCVLRQWLKSSLHTTPGVHESSIGTKLGRASSRPRGAVRHAVFPLLLSYALLVVIIVFVRPLESLDSRARAATMETLSRSPRISGESRSSAADAGNTSLRASSASARAAFPPLSSSAFSILLYWTCRIKSRTRHRTPRHKRTFEIIPGEIGPITVGVPLQIFRLATDRGPVELGIARRDPCFLRISNLLSLDRQMEWDLGMFRAANRRSFVRATHRLRDSAISGFDRFSLSLSLSRTPRSATTRCSLFELTSPVRRRNAHGEPKPYTERCT